LAAIHQNTNPTAAVALVLDKRTGISEQNGVRLYDLAGEADNVPDSLQGISARSDLLPLHGTVRHCCHLEGISGGRVARRARAGRRLGELGIMIHEHRYALQASFCYELATSSS
jgi:hypothetical protein